LALLLDTFCPTVRMPGIGQGNRGADDGGVPGVVSTESRPMNDLSILSTLR